MLSSLRFFFFLRPNRVKQVGVLLCVCVCAVLGVHSFISFIIAYHFAFALRTPVGVGRGCAFISLCLSRFPGYRGGAYLAGRVGWWVDGWTYTAVERGLVS